MNTKKSNEVVLMSTAKKSPPSVWSNHLLDVARNESRAAFKQLYEHFGPLIKSYFMAKFPAQNSASMVDELVQEVMIKVWQKAKSFDPNKAAASTWIFTLARNTRIDLLRRQNKYANTTSIETEDIWEDTTEHGPFALLQQNRDSKQVLEGIKKLPEEQALVIHKVYMESKSHTEVSEEMGLPLGTVKSRVRLAQTKLQTLISR